MCSPSQSAGFPYLKWNQRGASMHWEMLYWKTQIIKYLKEETSYSENPVLNFVRGYGHPEVIRGPNYPLRKTVGSAREENMSTPHNILQHSLVQLNCSCHKNSSDETTPLNKSRKTQYGKMSLPGPSWWITTNEMHVCALVLLGRLQKYRGSHDVEYKTKYRSCKFETSLECQTNYHAFIAWRAKGTTYLMRRVDTGVSNQGKNLPNTKKYQPLTADIIQIIILWVLTKLMI